MKPADTYPLGVVVVVITTTDGKKHTEDWPPDDVEGAREYAAETAHCRDVAHVSFEDCRTGERADFRPAASTAPTQMEGSAQ